MKVANQVGAPVTGAHDGDVNHARALLHHVHLKARAPLRPPSTVISAPWMPRRTPSGGARMARTRSELGRRDVPLITSRGACDDLTQQGRSPEHRMPPSP